MDHRVYKTAADELTKWAGATIVRRDTDTNEVIQSSNARSTVEADVPALWLTATWRSTELGHAYRRRWRLN